MAQALTDDLLDILADRFEVASRGYRARCEVDRILPAAPPDVTPGLVQQKSVTSPVETTVTMDSNPTIGDLLVARLIRRASSTTPAMFDGSWTLLGAGGADGSGGNTHGCVAIYAKIATSTAATIAREASANQMWMTVYEIAGGSIADATVLTGDHETGALDIGDFADATGVAIAAFAFPRGTDQDGNGFASTWPAGWIEEFDQTVDGNGPCQAGEDPWMTTARAVDEASLAASITVIQMCTFQYIDQWCGVAVLFGISGGTPAEVVTTPIRPSRIAIDKSRRLVAAQLQLDMSNEDGVFELSPDSIFQTNEVIRCYQWYGDEANEVRTFTGLIDEPHEGRDVRTISIIARDMMKRLIVQTFGATAPQGAGETGAVRTAANGVYLNMEASDIVIDILDRAGWPSADRDVTPTSYVLDEYIISDGQSWADAIINDNGPTGLAGYEAGADELGVFYFRPLGASKAADSDTDPVPDYSYVVSDPLGGDHLTSRNVIRLDHNIDDYDLKTRVKVRGNLAIVKAAWTELWHTNTFTKPVGIWYNPAASSFLFVLDRATKKIYRLQQSNRARAPLGIWPLYVGGNVTYPLGLSGDPADSDRFWVLEAAWRVTGGADLSASIHKYDASDGSHLAEYALPDGRWTDLKVSSSYLWLTNRDTDKTHKRSKTDGSSIASYTTVVSGIDQLNPTGVFVDDTTLGLFFLGHPRFVLVDESDPTTPDASNALGVASYTISTAGTNIIGGEMDTDTDAHLFACSDDLGLVWKFALTEPSTTEIAVELVDTDLEDELGLFAQSEDRVHDTHPGDPAHPFEVRRETLTLAKTITNLSQATETAQRVLDQLAHRRETLDWGIVGHPGHQRGDLHQVTDPVTGIDALYIVDTYRDNMDERGYLGTIAYVPYEPTY